MPVPNSSRGRRRKWTKVAAIVVALLIVTLSGLGIWGYRKYERISAHVRSGTDSLAAARHVLSTPVDQLDYPQVEAATAQLTCARRNWEQAWAEIEMLDFPLWWAGQNLPSPLDQAGSIPPLFRTAIHAARLGELAGEGLGPAVKVISSESAGEGKDEALPDLVAGLRQGTPRLEQAREEVVQLRLALLELQSRSVPESVQPLIAEIESYLPRLEESLSIALDIGPALESLLGMDSPRDYLLLAQNNYEIRATGGFIGSMGLVTLSEGEVSGMDFRSSYSFDNPDRRHIAPPAPYVKYLNATGLYLRDSNWWPDFPTSAAVAKEMFLLDQDKSVDGVIAIDMEAVKLLLEFTGPIEVAGYDTTVSAADFLVKSYHYIYSPEWMSSSPFAEDPQELKGKTFLKKLLQGLMDKLESTGPSRAPELLKTLERGLNEKHILLHFDDPRLMKYVVESGWDGRITATDGDYLFVVDSNLSFSDAGLFVDQRIDYQVTLPNHDTPPSARLVVGYRNRFDEALLGSRFGPIGGVIRDQQSQKMVDARGAFGDYVRVYAPRGSSLKRAEGFEGGLEEYEESGKTVFAGYVLILPGQEREVTLEWTPPDRLAEEMLSNHRYSLLVQKQPGTAATPLDVEVQLPGGTRATSKTPGAVVTDGQASFRSDLAVDRRFVLEIE